MKYYEMELSPTSCTFQVSAAADPSFRKRRNANSRAAGARGARRARGKPKVAALPVIEQLGAL
jgi:hypothetical protein